MTTEPAPLGLLSPLAVGEGGAVEDPEPDVLCAAGSVEVTTAAVEDGVKDAAPSSTVM